VEARCAGIPVIYTTVSYDEGDRRTAAAFIDKVPALLTLEAGSRWVEIDPRLAPLPEEPVLNKLFASAFFGTALGSFLAANGCDSLIVTGASTSGCVRATVVDALQHGYRPVVPQEAVGDRNPAAHEANLYDIDAKYGDVVPVDEVLLYVQELAQERLPPRAPLAVPASGRAGSARASVCDRQPDALELSEQRSR
jgi:maleamate amidohydrolase